MLLYGYKLQKEAKKQIKEIIKKMNGISEEEFLEKYAYDAMFKIGVDTLVDLFLQAKFK